MARRKIFHHIFPCFVAVTLLALLAQGYYASRLFRQAFVQQLTDELTARAAIVRAQVGRRLQKLDAKPDLNLLAEEVAKLAATRLTVIGGDGAVLADSDKGPESMENHANRPEVAAALRGEVGTAIRRSATLRRDMLYVALPARAQDGKPFLVRASYPLSKIDAVMSKFMFQDALGALAIALAMVALSWMVARKLAAPIRELSLGAAGFADGDLTRELPDFDIVEVDDLSRVMNSMAKSLTCNIRDITEQRNELNAILASMLEGVVAVDRSGRLMIANAAAARLLDISVSRVEGRFVEEAIRNTTVHDFIKRLLEEKRERVMELSGQGGQPRALRAHGAPLTGANGSERGCVVVISDITEMKKLENMRKDFVANVSHEINTPLTAIKGSVETLLDGALDEPEAAKNFLNIIIKHTDRLSALVRDLLDLARIEEQRDKGQLAFATTSVREVINNAVSLRAETIKERNVQLEIDCDPGLTARLSPQLIEQALVNFIDNALRYGHRDDRPSELKVKAVRADGKLTLSVRDNGDGIAKEHLPRLFERFYVVDKARSRKVGGTGLGLAIVKHAAQAHGGGVEVKSEPGKGSEFMIVIPD